MQLHDDGIADALDLLLLILELVHLGERVGIEPFDDLIALGVDRRLVGVLRLQPLVLNGML